MQAFSSPKKYLNLYFETKIDFRKNYFLKYENDYQADYCNCSDGVTLNKKCWPIMGGLVRNENTTLSIEGCKSNHGNKP